MGLSLIRVQPAVRKVMDRFFSPILSLRLDTRNPEAGALDREKLRHKLQPLHIGT